MAFRFFQIPARGCVVGEAELNNFLASHRVLTVDRRWLEMGENSQWAICVDYIPAHSAAADLKSVGIAGSNSRRGKVDYRDVLNPAEFAKFSAMRELRKTLAAEEGVPVYAVLTNEQMAHIVQARCRTRADLEKIDGFGDARVKKYAERILKCPGLFDEGSTDAKGVESL